MGNSGPDKDKVYVDKYGKKIKPMPADYGFRSGTGRLYEDGYGEVPKSVWELASQNFTQEFTQLRASFRFNPYYEEYIKVNPPQSPLGKFNVSVGATLSKAFGTLDEKLEAAGVLPKLDPPQKLDEIQAKEFEQIRLQLQSLKLDNAAVVREEEKRIAQEGDMAATPILVKIPFLALCWVLDVVYDNRPIPKFWVLETVARIPYFAYISILHLYESLGFWRAGAELRKIHFAEEWNEMHHLQIMESLGGDQMWFDRFLAEHSALLYYWLLIFFYLVNPKVAYNFMQRVEHHASDTYSVFLEQNKDILAKIPPPTVAVHYYRNKDLYLFDEFQAGHDPENQRRPECNNLLDVFTNIRDDENEHVKTMAACQTEDISKIVSSK